MNASRIRALQTADIEPCARLMSEAALWARYNVTYSSAADRFRSGLDSGALIMVADTGKAGEAAIASVQGFVWLVTNGAFNRSGYIPLIGVAAAAQGQGVGRALLTFAEDYFRPQCRDVFLLCADFNHDARRFYERMGYENVGALPDYVLPDVTEIIYRKRLR